MKVCSKCGVTKNESDFGHHRDVYNGCVKYYDKGFCIACERKYQRDWNKRRRDLMPPKPQKPVETHRVCKCCQEVKEVCEFGNLRGKQNVKQTCKKCICKKSMSYYEKKKDDERYKESKRLKSLEWYERNNDYAKERNRQYNKSEKHKSRRRSLYKDKYAKDKDHILKKCKEYNKRKIASLSDQYIIIQLEKEGIDRLVSRQYPQLIEAKRVQLLIKRQINAK